MEEMKVALANANAKASEQKKLKEREKAKVCPFSPLLSSLISSPALNPCPIYRLCSWKLQLKNSAPGSLRPIMIFLKPRM